MPVPERERNQPLTRQSSPGRMAAVWAARALVAFGQSTKISVISTSGHNGAATAEREHTAVAAR